MYVWCHERPHEWSHCLKLLKIKSAVDFLLRRKQKQRKQNPSPEGTLVLLSASGKSGGVWYSQLPCLPQALCDRLSRGFHREAPPLSDLQASENVSREHESHLCEATAQNRGSVVCQALPIPLRWAQRLPEVPDAWRGHFCSGFSLC